MSHIWYVVLDATQQKLDVGQGYRKVGLWYGMPETMDALAEMMDIAYKLDAPLRVVGENAASEPPLDEYSNFPIAAPKSNVGGDTNEAKNTDAV